MFCLGRLAHEKFYATDSFITATTKVVMFALLSSPSRLESRQIPFDWDWMESIQKTIIISPIMSLAHVFFVTFGYNRWILALDCISQALRDLVSVFSCRGHVFPNVGLDALKEPAGEARGFVQWVSQRMIDFEI